MWIMTNKGMLSLVEHRDHPGILIVRSRDRQALEAHFPDYEPIETRQADYRWRVMLPKAQVAMAVANLVTGIDYPNFKSSVQDQALHDAYLGCWGVMHRYQTRVNGPSDQYSYGLFDDDRDAIQESYPPGWPIGGIAIDADTGAYSDDIDDGEEFAQAADGAR